MSEPIIDLAEVAAIVAAECSDVSQDAYYADGGRYLRSFPPRFHQGIAPSDDDTVTANRLRMLSRAAAQVCRYRRANGHPWTWVKPPFFERTERGIELMLEVTP